MPGLLRTIPGKSTISAAFSISLVQHTYLYPFLPHLASFLSWTTNDGQSQLYTWMSHCPQSNSDNLYVSWKSWERPSFHQSQLEESGSLHMVPRALAETMDKAVVKSLWKRKWTKVAWILFISLQDTFI